MKVLATPRSFGKNNPELFDILRDAGLDVVRNDTGGILSADRMCEKLADCDGLIVGVDPVDATVLAAAPQRVPLTQPMMGSSPRPQRKGTVSSFCRAMARAKTSSVLIKAMQSRDSRPIFCPIRWLRARLIRA